jgi:hypothetical protein
MGVGLDIFLGLEANEQEAEDEGQRQGDVEHRALAILERVMGNRDGDA